MITLRVTFLLAIDLNEESVKKKILKKQKKDHNSKKLKFLKNKSKSAKSKKVAKPEENPCYCVIEVQNPICYTHIEYELFPKKFKYAVDVVCWGPVAKVYTKNGSKSFKTVIQENIIWVPVFIEHYLNALPNEEIRKLLKQVINVSIKTGKGSVGAKAKSDKTKIFYLYKDDFTNTFFAEVYNEKPHCEDRYDIRKKEIERILLNLLNFPVEHEIVSWAYNIDDIHAYKICSIVTKRAEGKEISFKDFYEEETKVKKDKKKNKKNKKKKRQEKNLKLGVKIPSHVLLSDPVLSSYQIKETGSRISEIYILLSSENILTSFQKQQLCPLVVKIRKLSNLPTEILVKNGFEQIYVNCIIPDIAEFNTSLRNINEQIQFDESRFIITSDLPNIKVLEMLQTRRAVLKILGVKSASAKNLLQKKDKKKQKKSQESEIVGSDDIDLAVATFDLSALLKTFHLFKEKGQCYNIRSVSTEQPHVDPYFMDRITIQELNLTDMNKKRPNSILADPSLFWRGTTLKFEAYFLTPPHPLFYIRDVTSSYRRLLVIMFDKEIAKSFFENIILHNYRVLGPGPILAPHFLIQKRTSTTTKINSEKQKALSGFLLDDWNSFIFFLEGPSNGYILELIHKVSGLNSTTAKVFYNSEYLFEDRLFPTFFKNCGLVVITLKLPLVDIFMQEKTYIEGNVPVHCFKAIQKINLVLNSSTFKTILSHNLIPTEIELLSFSLEYAYQVRHQFKQLKKESYFDMAATNVDLFGQTPFTEK